jgi:hypothetical protein
MTYNGNLSFIKIENEENLQSFGIWKTFISTRDKIDKLEFKCIDKIKLCTGIKVSILLIILQINIKIWIIQEYAGEILELMQLHIHFKTDVLIFTISLK